MHVGDFCDIGIARYRLNPTGKDKGLPLVTILHQSSFIGFKNEAFLRRKMRLI
jgi:hypothetical protein